MTVCRRAFSFKRRLTDTYDLGNLPQVGTGFAKVHASLREIPEGDEKYGRLSAPYFLSFENDEVGGSLFFNRSNDEELVFCLSILIHSSPLKNIVSQDSLYSPRVGLPVSLTGD